MKVLSLLIRIAVGFIEFILAVRFILRLLGATESSSSFVQWFYENSAGLVAPFTGILTNITFGKSFVLEFSTIIAIAIYAVVGYLLSELVQYIDKSFNRG